MIKIVSLAHAKTSLLDGEILVYKPLKGKVTFLVLKDDNRITLINDNLRYNISFIELNELLRENNIYIYEKDNNLEINHEFKKLIQ